MTPLFDVIIPVAPKDYKVVPYCVKGVKSHCINASNIYIVSMDDLNIDGTIWINESAFPFSKEAIKSVNPSIEMERTGWYLQQIINFYS